MDDKVFETVNHLRRETQASPGKDTVDVDLSLLEANSWLSQTNPANARSVLQSVLKRHPDDVRTLNLVLRAYLMMGDSTNAMQLVYRQLAKEPENAAALVNRAAILMRMGNDEAAETVYRKLETARKEIDRVYYGLAQIAEHRHDTNLAIRQLELCLSNTPSRSAQWNEVNARLNALKPRAQKP
jgi:predicted Zn-dependent protease